MKTEKNSENINKKIGDRVRACREFMKIRDKKYTQAFVAEYLNISDQQMRNIESGARSLTVTNAKKLAKLFDVNYLYLLCETDCKNGSPVLFNDGCGELDFIFMWFVSALGHDVKFEVVRIYDADMPIYTATFEELDNFSLSRSQCKIKVGVNSYDCCIVAVYIDGRKTAFSQFIVMCEMIYTYVGFTFTQAATIEETAVKATAIMAQAEITIEKAQAGIYNQSIDDIEKIKKWSNDVGGYLETNNNI